MNSCAKVKLLFCAAITASRELAKDIPLLPCFTSKRQYRLGGDENTGHANCLAAHHLPAATIDEPTISNDIKIFVCCKQSS